MRTSRDVCFARRDPNGLSVADNGSPWGGDTPPSINDGSMFTAADQLNEIWMSSYQNLFDPMMTGAAFTAGAAIGSHSRRCRRRRWGFRSGHRTWRTVSQRGDLRESGSIRGLRRRARGWRADARGYRGRGRGGQRIAGRERRHGGTECEYCRDDGRGSGPELRRMLCCGNPRFDRERTTRADRKPSRGHARANARPRRPAALELRPVLQTFVHEDGRMLALTLLEAGGKQEVLHRHDSAPVLGARARGLGRRGSARGRGMPSGPRLLKA